MSVAGWSTLLETYEATAVESWAFRQCSVVVVPADTAMAESRTPGRVDHPQSLTGDLARRRRRRPLPLVHSSPRSPPRWELRPGWYPEGDMNGRPRLYGLPAPRSMRPHFGQACTSAIYRPRRRSI